MPANRIYSVHFKPTIPINGAYFNVCWLAVGRRFKIKTITWDWRAQIGTAFVPYEKLDSLNCQLLVGDGVPATTQQYTYPFDSFTIAPVPATDFNGTRLYIYRPKQVQFTNFEVYDKIPLQIDVNSIDLVNAYTMNIDIAIEIEIEDGVNFN